MKIWESCTTVKKMESFKNYQAAAPPETESPGRLENQPLDCRLLLQKRTGHEQPRARGLACGYGPQVVQSSGSIVNVTTAGAIDAAEEQASVVYSAAKIIQPRGRTLNETMKIMRVVYKDLAAPQKPLWRGGSWRLPKPILDEHVVGPFLEICRQKNVTMKFCMQDLLETL